MVQPEFQHALTRLNLNIASLWLSDYHHPLQLDRSFGDPETGHRFWFTLTAGKNSGTAFVQRRIGCCTAFWNVRIACERLFLPPIHRCTVTALRVIPKDSVALFAQQRTAQAQGSHAVLGRLQQCIMEQLRGVGHDAATTQSPPVVYDPIQPESESAALQIAISMGDTEIPIVLLDDPRAWLDASTKHLQDVLQTIQTVFSKEEFINLIDVDPVKYPRLFAYTLTHTKLCTAPHKLRLLGSLNAHRHFWNLQDPIALLIGHRSTLHVLLGFLNRSNMEPPKDNKALAYIRNLLKLDTMGIAAQTLDILNDLERNELLGQSGDMAQATLDHMKWLLDVPELGGWNHSLVLNAIFILTRKCGQDLEYLDTQFPTVIQPGWSNSGHGIRNLGQSASRSTRPPTPKFPNSKRSQFPVFRDDIIIVVMGPMGVGKSSFINKALGQEVAASAGNGLKSCTAEIRPYRCPYTDRGESNVVLLDTPGLDDKQFTDSDILAGITQWLQQSYGTGVTLAALLYLHRISDNRTFGALLRHLEMFERLCENDHFRNVVLVTTIWDQGDAQVGPLRRLELERTYWGSMIDHGSRIPFHNTKESAWEIIRQVVDFARPVLATPATFDAENIAATQKLEDAGERIPKTSWRTEQEEDWGSGLYSDPQSPIPSPIFDTRWSAFYDEKLSHINTRTSFSSQIYDTTLSEAVTTLRFATDLKLVPALQNTIAMALEVAQLIAEVQEVQAELVLAVYKAGQLVLMLSEHAQSESVIMLDAVEQAIDDLVCELKIIRQIARVMRRPGITRLLRQPARQQRLAARCVTRIQVAIAVFKMEERICQAGMQGISAPMMSVADTDRYLY